MAVPLAAAAAAEAAGPTTGPWSCLGDDDAFEKSAAGSKNKSNIILWIFMHFNLSEITCPGEFGLEPCLLPGWGTAGRPSRPRRELKSKKFYKGI